jgi:hypothetical protein
MIVYYILVMSETKKIRIAVLYEEPKDGTATNTHLILFFKNTPIANIIFSGETNQDFQDFKTLNNALNELEILDPNIDIDEKNIINVKINDNAFAEFTKKYNMFGFSGRLYIGDGINKYISSKNLLNIDVLKRILPGKCDTNSNNPSASATATPSVNINPSASAIATPSVNINPSASATAAPVVNASASTQSKSSPEQDASINGNNQVNESEIVIGDNIEHISSEASASTTNASADTLKKNDTKNFKDIISGIYYKKTGSDEYKKYKYETSYYKEGGIKLGIKNDTEKLFFITVLNSDIYIDEKLLKTPLPNFATEKQLEMGDIVLSNNAIPTSWSFAKIISKNNDTTYNISFLYRGDPNNEYAQDRLMSTETNVPRDKILYIMTPPAAGAMGGKKRTKTIKKYKKRSRRTNKFARRSKRRV